MKRNIKPAFPLITLGAGGLGLCLRLWLLSRVDEQGLLPANHFAGIATFILFALFMAALFLFCRTLKPAERYSLLFPADLWGAVGNIAGAAAVVYSLFIHTRGIGLLSVLCIVAGIIAAGCLLFTGYCRFCGIHPSFLFHMGLTVFFMLYLVARCRVWGAQPQLQVYFFPFMASIFLLLTAYQRTVLDAGGKQQRWYVLFNQAAAFCCLLSAAGEGKLFYLGMAAWAMTNAGAFRAPHRHHPTQEEV